MTLDQVAWPAAWQTVPLWSLFRRVKDVGHPNEQMLSVYRDHGVIQKESRDDNFNKTAQNRNIYQLVDHGWLILNRMKAWQGSVGVSTFRGIVSGHYICFQPRHQNDPRFLNHLLRSPIYTAEMRRLSRGVRPSQFEIDNDLLRVLPIHLPPLMEQKAIADYLDDETARIDALITKKRRLIELFRSRVGSLVTAHHDSAVRDYGELPIKAVADVRVSNVDKKSYDDDRAVSLCNYTDVYYNRRIDPSMVFMKATADRNQIQKLELKSGDVLVTKDSEMASDIGVPALVSEDLPGVVLGYHLAMFRPLERNGPFLYWMLQSQRARDHLSLGASGVTRFGLRQDTLGSVPVPNVPLQDQQPIVHELESAARAADGGVDKLNRQIELLDERRQALITAAVTGELEIPGVAA